MRSFDKKFESTKCDVSFFYDNNSVKFPCSKIVSFIIFNPDGSSFDFDDKSLLNVKYAE